MGELTNRTTRTSAQLVGPVRTTRTHPYRGCALCVILCAATGANKLRNRLRP